MIGEGTKTTENENNSKNSQTRHNQILCKMWGEKQDKTRFKSICSKPCGVAAFFSSAAMYKICLKCTFQEIHYKSSVWRIFE